MWLHDANAYTVCSKYFLTRTAFQFLFILSENASTRSSNSQAALKQRSHVTAWGGRTASHFGGRCQFPASHQRSVVQRRDSGDLSREKGRFSVLIWTCADLNIRNRDYLHRKPGRNVSPATKMRRSNDSDCNWQRLQLVFKMAAWLALAFCWTTRNFSLSKLRSQGFTSVSTRYVFSGIISYQWVFSRLAVLRECAGFCELKMDPRFAGCRRWQTEGLELTQPTLSLALSTHALRFLVLLQHMVRYFQRYLVMLCKEVCGVLL